MSFYSLHLLSSLQYSSMWSLPSSLICHISFSLFDSFANFRVQLIGQAWQKVHAINLKQQPTHSSLPLLILLMLIRISISGWLNSSRCSRQARMLTLLSFCVFSAIN